MVMIIVQVKGTQNICCDGNTSMSKSLTSKRQNLKKKTKKNTKMEWNTRKYHSWLCHEV